MFLVTTYVVQHFFCWKFHKNEEKGANTNARDNEVRKRPSTFETGERQRWAVYPQHWLKLKDIPFC